MKEILDNLWVYPMHDTSLFLGARSDDDDDDQPQEEKEEEEEKRAEQKHAQTQPTHLQKETANTKSPTTKKVDG